MSRTSSLFASSVIAVFAFCVDAAAVDETGFRFGYAAGAPVGLAFGGHGTGTTAPLTVAALARFEAASVLALRPEVSAVIPYGIGANLVIDLVRTEAFRLHVLDPGVFWNLIEPVSVSRVRRDADITFGGGIEIAVTRRVMLGLDWRAFVPPPERVIADYGDFARPAFAEVLKGGQTWAGLTWFCSL